MQTFILYAALLQIIFLCLRHSVRADFLLLSCASTGKRFGKKGKNPRGSELKAKEQILKARHRKEKLMQRQNKGRPRGKGNKGKFGRKK